MIDFKPLFDRMASCRHSVCDAIDFDGDGTLFDACYQCRRPGANYIDRQVCSLASLDECRFFEAWASPEAVDPLPKGVAREEDMEVEL